MRTFLYIILFLTTIVSAQKVSTKTGIVSFDGSVVNFEPVRAKNESVTCVLNTKNGQIASLILVKGFRFKTALMEEHFNENYIESAKYPKAILKGSLVDFDIKDITSKPKEYVLKGKLELHGVQKNVTINVLVSKKDNGIVIESNFVLNAADYEIDIPSFVRNKMKSGMNVNVNFTLL